MDFFRRHQNPQADHKGDAIRIVIATWLLDLIGYYVICYFFPSTDPNVAHSFETTASLFVWSLIPSFVFSIWFWTLGVLMCLCNLGGYVLNYTVMVPRIIAITYGEDERVELVRITRQNSEDAIAALFIDLFPSLKGKRIVGIAEVSVDTVVIPLSMIPTLALDFYVPIVYEIITEDHMEPASVAVGSITKGTASACPFKKFKVEDLFEAALLKPLKDGESTFSDNAIEFSDDSSDEEEDEDEDDEGSGSNLTPSERRQIRHEFSEELRKRGYAVISMPKNFRILYHVKRLVACMRLWYHLHPYDKSSCTYQYDKSASSTVGWHVEKSREFFEIREMGRTHADRMPWWPRSKDHLAMPPVGGRKTQQSIADALKEESAKVFYSHHYLATQMLELFSEELGLDSTELSSKLQKLPLRQPDEVSASMYRVYQYHSTRYRNSRGRTKWYEWPILKQLFNAKLEEAEPPHVDLGLVTVSSKSAITGLQVLDMGVECHKGQGGRGAWLHIEDWMDENDFAVFTGSSLANISSSFYRPLFHRVVPVRDCRFSLPFFLRYASAVNAPIVNPEHICLTQERIEKSIAEASKEKTNRNGEKEEEKEGEKEEEEGIVGNKYVGVAGVSGLARRTVARRRYRGISHPILRRNANLKDAESAAEYQYMMLQLTVSKQKDD